MQSVIMSGKPSLEAVPDYLLKYPTMRFFWPIYFFSAVAGTAAVYFAAPLARPYVPEYLKLPAPAQPGREAAPPPALVMKAVTSRAPAAPFTPGAEEAAAPVQAESAERPAAAAEELPPALHGIYLAQRNEKPGWGITHQRTVYYTLDGTRAGQVEGGALIEFRGTRTSSKGGMVECLFHANGASAAPVLVSVNDVYLFTGDFRKLSERQLSDLRAYYALSGKIALRKRELLQVAAEKNPFFEQYQAAYNTLMKHIESAKKVSAERERATELNKMRIEDQLREMKMTEARLRREYDAAHLKFRTWKEQHAAETAKPDEDPFVKQWSQQRAELIPRVPGLAY